MSDSERIQLTSVLLTMSETAEMLRKTVPSLRWMVHNETAPRSAVIGNRRMFRRADVERYINEAFENAS